MSHLTVRGRFTHGSDGKRSGLGLSPGIANAQTTPQPSFLFGQVEVSESVAGATATLTVVAGPAPAASGSLRIAAGQTRRSIPPPEGLAPDYRVSGTAQAGAGYAIA